VAWLRRLLRLIGLLLYGWVAGLLALLRFLLRRRVDDGLTEHERRAARSPCVPIDEPAFVRPDPLIYSQDKLMSLGLAVIWDNPDVQLFRGGVAVDSSQIEAGTTYEVRIRVWNNSTDCPVVNMPVHLVYANAGIGSPGQLIGTATVDVGVKGSATQPGFCTIPWTTPATPGHYCLRARLDPVSDVDFSNNVGQENTQVGEAHSPAAFTFELMNPDRNRHAYRFETDSYELRRHRCDDEEHRDPQRAHAYGSHPVPEGWRITITPLDPVLAPGETVDVSVAVDPPSAWTGRQTINVNAFHELGFAGGMTLVVTR
jgi:hypothetical protein